MRAFPAVALTGATLALINQLEATSSLQAGKPYKVVTGGTNGVRMKAATAIASYRNHRAWRDASKRALSDANSGTGPSTSWTGLSAPKKFARIFPTCLSPTSK